MISFTDGSRRQKASEVAYRDDAIRLRAGTGKPVLCADYSKKRALREHALRQAGHRSYVLLVTDRELTTLGSCGGEMKSGEARTSAL